MDKKSDFDTQAFFLALIANIALILVVSYCAKNSSSIASTSSSTPYSSSSSSKSKSSSSSEYKSGKGDAWDEEVNKIADEYDMDPKEIDAMMRSIEQG